MGAYRTCAIAAALLSLMVMTGCCGIRLDPRDDTPRTITLATDHSKALAFREGMVWCMDMSAQSCLRLPPGTYTIEGEDAEWLFFRAPERIDFRVFDGKTLKDQRFIPGGIALRKHFDIMLPAEVYIDPGAQQTTDKVLIYKLGNDFMAREHNTWTRNF